MLLWATVCARRWGGCAAGAWLLQGMLREAAPALWLRCMRAVKQPRDELLKAWGGQGGKCLKRLWQVVAAPLAELASVDFGPPLHSLILAGDTHVVEEELLAHFRVPTRLDATERRV